MPGTPTLLRRQPKQPKELTGTRDTSSTSAASPIMQTCCPTSITFSPDSRFLSFITDQRTLEGLALDLVTTTSTTTTTTHSTNDSYRFAKFFPASNSGNTYSTNSNSNSNISDSSYHSEDDYESLSLAEKLRRERQRLSYNGTGIHTYHWLDNSLLVPQRESIFYTRNYLEEDLKCIYSSATSSDYHNEPMDVRFSSSGRMIGFTSGGNLFCIILDDNNHRHNNNNYMKPIQLTFNEEDGVSYGTPDFLSMEEMSRYEGYWFTDCDDGIVFTKVDERAVDKYRIYYDVNDLKNGSTAAERARANAAAVVAGGEADYDDSVMTTNRSGGNDQHDSSLSSSESAPNTAAKTTTEFEEHRYPFAGQANPVTEVGYLPLSSLLMEALPKNKIDISNAEEVWAIRQERAKMLWREAIQWHASPENCNEYLAAVTTIPNTNNVICSWQNRAQNTISLCQWNIETNQSTILLVEQSRLWINLANINIHILPPSKNGPKDVGSYDFLLASERTGFAHLYLYRNTGKVNQPIILLRTVSVGEWIVESILGVDIMRDLVYVQGTFDSPLERHAYALPLYSFNHATTHTQDPYRITQGPGMHNVILDGNCQYMCDSCSDLSHPTRVTMYELTMRHQQHVPEVRQLHVLHDSAPSEESLSPKTAAPNAGVNAKQHSRLAALASGVTSSALKRGLIFNNSKTLLNGGSSSSNNGSSAHRSSVSNMVEATEDASSTSSIGQQYMNMNTTVNVATTQPPELLSFPSSTDTNTMLHAALYRPDPAQHGLGPYPTIVAVYGGPHVQRVQRSYSLLCTDMRAQRLRSLGFAVLKCDNRGSSRRGLAFEGVIRDQLGYFEVQDQVVAVQTVVRMGIADPQRVGIYGWSYGGYLSAMCLCRAPDVFRVAVAGAPVTSWDGYDTHYTERYMSTPKLNPVGYRESSVFHHVPNIRKEQRLMLVHGLIDENVHYRHSSRLMEELKKCGKDYDLLLFPDARHSPRKIRDRVYMEQKICDYFVRNLKQVKVVSLESTGRNTRPRPVRRNSSRSVTSSNINADDLFVRPMAGHL